VEATGVFFACLKKKCPLLKGPHFSFAIARMLCVHAMCAPKVVSIAAAKAGKIFY
jgi:hypothetical protein